MSLIHIHVLTCVHVPISISHVTIQNKHLNFLNALVNLETATLSPPHG